MRSTRKSVREPFQKSKHRHLSSLMVALASALELLDAMFMKPQIQTCPQGPCTRNWTHCIALEEFSRILAARSLTTGEGSLPAIF